MIKLPFTIKSKELPTNTQLYDEETFYKKFKADLKKCGHELVIESPFVTNRRVAELLPIFQKLKSHKVRVLVNTRDPEEHDEQYLKECAQSAIAELQHAGIHVVYTRSIHRKLVIIDRRILYEGSLNVLSQNNSKEIMRRIDSTALAWQMARFVNIDQFVG